MIDVIVNTFVLIGIVAVSIPVLLFAMAGVAHMAYRAYTLTIED